MTTNSDGKSDEHLFKERRYRCEVCLGDIRIEKITPKINKLWHPRCGACGRGMRELDKHGAFVEPKPPKPKPPKPQMPGQLSFDGSVT